MRLHLATATWRLLAILVLTFLVHLLVIGEPFGRDQGIFAYIGDTLLHGGVPYLDAWDHKPPGLYAIYALAFALFGRGMPSVHLLEAFAITLAALALYAVGCLTCGQRAGLLAALFYGLGATLLFEWWDRGQAEVYMGLTGTVAVYCFLRHRVGANARLAPGRGEHKVRPYMFLCGLFCGFTLYLKPTGAPLVAGLFLALVLMSWRKGAARVVSLAASMGLGFVVSFVPLVMYFAANGALDDFVQSVVVFNTYHARIGGNPTLAGIVSGTLDFLAAMNILAPLALAGIALACARRDGSSPHAAPLLLVWLVASAAGIWTQGKFFSYHWSPVLPPLALFAAIAVEYAARELAMFWGARRVESTPVAGPPGAISQPQRSQRAQRQKLPFAFSAPSAVGILVYGLIAIIYIAALATDHASKWTRDLSFLLGRTPSDAYLAQFGHNIQGRDIYSFSETQDTARYLQAHTNADDYVLVWGFQALVNFLAERRSPTRYIFNYPLSFDRPESAFRVEARRTFLRDLKERPPVYIVLVTNDVNPLQPADSSTLVADFPEFQDIIRQRYRLETDIGEFHLYRRIDA